MHHAAVRLKEVIKKMSKVFMIVLSRVLYQSIYSFIMLWLNDLQMSEVYLAKRFPVLNNCTFENIMNVSEFLYREAIETENLQ